MFTVTKRLEVSASHQLKLDYPSKCLTLHGHNWIITVYCKSKELNHNGMVEDFTKIKQKIADQLDHQYINHIVAPLMPTAENIAKWICDQIGTCYKVEVQESEGNVATYEV